MGGFETIIIRDAALFSTPRNSELLHEAADEEEEEAAGAGVKGGGRGGAVEDPPTGTKSPGWVPLAHAKGRQDSGVGGSGGGRGGRRCSQSRSVHVKESG